MNGFLWIPMCIKVFTLNAIVVKNWRDSAVLKGATS